MTHKKPIRVRLSGSLWPFKCLDWFVQAVAFYRITLFVSEVEHLKNEVYKTSKTIFFNEDMNKYTAWKLHNSNGWRERKKSMTHSKHLSDITDAQGRFIHWNFLIWKKFLIELIFSISIFSYHEFRFKYLSCFMLLFSFRQNIFQFPWFIVNRTELSTTVVNVKCVSFMRRSFILFLSTTKKSPKQFVQKHCKR